MKTTGGKGLHVCVPLVPERGWEELEEFTRAVALRLAREEPAAFTANMSKAQRKGKVYVDYLRNVRGANAVGAWSTRAREGAPVSVPVEWDELDRLSSPRDLTVAEAPLRVLAYGSGRADGPVGPLPRAEAARARLAHPRARGLTSTIIAVAGPVSPIPAGRAVSMSLMRRVWAVSALTLLPAVYLPAQAPPHRPRPRPLRRTPSCSPLRSASEGISSRVKTTPT